MPFDRTAMLIRRFAVAISVFVCLAATAVYMRHRGVPGSKELWELGLLVGAEIALVTTGLSFVAQSIAYRARHAGQRRSATQFPSPLRSH